MTRHALVCREMIADCQVIMNWHLVSNPYRISKPTKRTDSINAYVYR